MSGPISSRDGNPLDESREAILVHVGEGSWPLTEDPGRA
jgi:hypothetical protein